MVTIKLLVLFVILTSLMCPEIVEAAAKKQRQNMKHKKTNQNGKLKSKLKQVPVFKASQRNAKMNYYNSHLWPSANNYYRPATTSSLYLHSPSTTSSSMFHPMHWGNTFVNPSSFVASNTLKRTDDFSSSSSPISTAQSSMISMPSLNTPLMSISNSQIPTLYDMSAFTGNAGLMEHPLATSNQNLWSMGETVAPTQKAKLNLFNSFNYNDDGGLFGGFLNQFLK